MEWKIGIVGARRGTSFAAVFGDIPNARLHAVCDLDANRAEFVKNEFGFARAFAELDDLLDSGVDVLVVATPPTEHVAHAVAALDRGIHVLSEVPAAHTIDECFTLRDAVKRSDARYMLAENYRYMTEIELVKRLADAGKFGELYYAEGAYIHDCRNLRFDANGSVTWRGRYPGGILYCTHSLAPINYWFGERVASVACRDSGASDGRARLQGGFASYESDSALCKTDAGSLFHVRVDVSSPRPHNMAQFVLQGSKGAYESSRGAGDPARVFFTERDDTVPDARWEPLAAYAEAFLPANRRNPPAEASRGGHGTSEYFLCREFLDAVEHDRPMPIDDFAALNCTAPGLYAIRSKASDGAPVAIPDFRAP